MKLYWFWSTNPQKVRWALEELAADYERIEIDLFASANRAPSFLALNPQGQLPVLVDGDQVIRQSNAILVHLGTTTDKLWPSGPADRVRAHEWLAFEASDLQPHAGTLWFGETILPRLGKSLSEERRRRAVTQLNRQIAFLDGVLADRVYLMEDFSLVDCSIGIWLAALEPTSFDLTPYENVRRYLTDLQSRPAFLRSEIRYGAP